MSIDSRSFAGEGEVIKPAFDGLVEAFVQQGPSAEMLAFLRQIKAAETSPRPVGLDKPDGVE